MIGNDGNDVVHNCRVIIMFSFACVVSVIRDKCQQEHCKQLCSRTVGKTAQATQSVSTKKSDLS